MTATSTTMPPTPRASAPLVARESLWSRIRRGSLWISITTVAIMILLWEVIPQIGIVNRILFPTFSDTILGFGQLVSGG
ncbi:hypothetical protein, partial [Yonghaparkia sp. Soil809]|uniref:hypothetical protein n=1 Tax=Yonghaparkia sp. Soil809 TaxID=1736417 RepID=UPI001F19C8D0